MRFFVHKTFWFLPLFCILVSFTSFEVQAGNPLIDLISDAIRNPRKKVPEEKLLNDLKAILPYNYTKETGEFLYTAWFFGQARAYSINDIQEFSRKSWGFESPAVRSATALGYASAFGYAQVVDWLLEMGADPNIQREKHNRPIDLAIRYGHRKVVDRLLEDERTQVGSAFLPLRLDYLRPNVSDDEIVRIIQALVDRSGGSLDGQNGFGQTALMAAIEDFTRAKKGNLYWYDPYYNSVMFPDSEKEEEWVERFFPRLIDLVLRHTSGPLLNVSDENGWIVEDYLIQLAKGENPTDDSELERRSAKALKMKIDQRRAELGIEAPQSKFQFLIPGSRILPVLDAATQTD